MKKIILETGGLYPCCCFLHLYTVLWSPLGEVLGFTRGSDCLLTLFWFSVRCSPELGLDSIVLKQRTLTLSDNFLPQKEDGCWKPLNGLFILCQNSSRLYVHWQVVKGSAPRVLFDHRKGFPLCHSRNAYAIILLKFHFPKPLCFWLAGNCSFSLWEITNLPLF